MKWNTRATQSIFSMVVVDCYKLRTGCQGVNPGGAGDFVEDLATALIDNVTLTKEHCASDARKQWPMKLL